MLPPKEVRRIYRLPPLPPTSPGLDDLMIGFLRFGLAVASTAKDAAAFKGPAAGPTRKLATLESWRLGI